MPRHDLLKNLRVGDVITADHMNQIARLVNTNTHALRKPQQRADTGEGAGDGGGDSGSTGGGGSVGNESFTANAADITSTTVTITDNGGNTHDIERIDTIVFTEDNSGRTLTLDINYT